MVKQTQSGILSILLCSDHVLRIYKIIITDNNDNNPNRIFFIPTLYLVGQDFKPVLFVCRVGPVHCIAHSLIQLKLFTKSRIWAAKQRDALTVQSPITKYKISYFVPKHSHTHTVCCVGGTVKRQSKLSTTRLMRQISHCKKRFND